MASLNQYPSDGSLPLQLSIDLSNVNTRNNSIINTQFLNDSNGNGYDVFDGSHGGNNVILSNPSNDPNYKGGYFYSGVYINGKFLAQPTIVGGETASNLAAFTPNHLELTLSADKTTYSVTATYAPTNLTGPLSVLNGSIYTIGPGGTTVDGNNSAANVQFLKAPSGNAATNIQLASILAKANLVPTSVSAKSQFELPDGTKATIVSATVPGYMSGDIAALLGTKGFRIPQTQNMSNFMVTSKPLDPADYLNAELLSDVIKKSDKLSDATKQWLIGDRITYYSPKDTGKTNAEGAHLQGDAFSSYYTTNRLFGNILAYGVAATFSGNYLNPLRDDNNNLTTSSSGIGQTKVRWDALDNIHGLWLTDQNGNSNPVFSQDDLNTIEDLIKNTDGIGLAVYPYACFLPGTLIRTEQGERAVETLRPGEKIFTLPKEGDTPILRMIMRIEHYFTTVLPYKEDDNAGWPVRIKKDAFANGIPSQDLYVTAEHCFFFDGYFVPIRMLVNGESISYDHEQSHYEFFHIEVEKHSVIWANNTLTESWLDTQSLFHPSTVHSEIGEHVEGSTKVVSFPRRFSWQCDAAYPLNTERSFVEPLYRRFVNYSDRIKRDETSCPGSEIYLELSDGRKIFPLRRRGKYIFFKIFGCSVAFCVIRSKVFRPYDAVGPFLDDRRYLGVLVGEIFLWTGARSVKITSHLDESHLLGWDIVEAGPHRWTKGAAYLPLPAMNNVPPVERNYLLVLEIEAEGSSYGAVPSFESKREMRVSYDASAAVVLKKRIS